MESEILYIFNIYSYHNTIIHTIKYLPVVIEDLPFLLFRFDTTSLMTISFAGLIALYNSSKAVPC